jgi:glycine/D-amino acid oxidase-like deaminating enzyme
MNDLTFDVVVIGGGIIGCTSAFFLARQGLTVAVLERGQLAQGTSSNSFAWINGTSKTAAEDYHRLNAAGLAAYNELATEFGESVIGLNPSGAMNIVRAGDDSAYKAVQEQWRQLQAFGYPVAWLKNPELQVMEPRIELDEDSEALLSMADLCLDAPRFVQVMAQQFKALGGRVFEECPARSLDMDEEGRIAGVVCDAGLIKSKKVLLAAGPGTAEVLSELTGFDGFAARFPLRRVPGMLLTTPDLSPHCPVRSVVYWAGDPELHVLPHFNGGVKLGADDCDGMVSEDDGDEVRRRAGAELLRRAGKRLKGLPQDLQVDDCQLGVGIRPYPEDGHSIAGGLPGAEGLYVIATHSGITLAPVLGRLMAQFIASDNAPPMLAPFGIDRFPGFVA